MGRRTGIFAGQNKFSTIRLLFLMAGEPLLIITFVVFSLFMPKEGEIEAGVTPKIPLGVIIFFIIIWLIYIGLGILFGLIYPIIIKSRKLEEANKIHLCCEGSIKVGKSPSEWMLLPFYYVEEIVINWDDENLKNFMDSNEGIRMKQILEREIAIKQYFELWTLEQNIDDQKLMNMKEAELNKLIDEFEKEIKTKEGEITETMEKDKIKEERLKTLYKYRAKLPTSELDLDSQEIEREKIKGLYFYYGYLDDPQSFEGYEAFPFNRAILVTPEPKEKCLKTYTRPVLDQDDYEINVHQVYTQYNLLSFTLDGIPMLKLYNSENMETEQSSIVINAMEINYIKIYVLRQLWNESKFYAESAALSQEKERRLKLMYREKYHLTIQELSDIDDILAIGSEERVIRKLHAKAESLKKYKALSIILGIICFILLIIIFIMGSSLSGMKQIDPEDVELTVQFYNLSKNRLINSILTIKKGGIIYGI